ncbi:hypothetical protein [Streptomyces zhihengii]
MANYRGYSDADLQQSMELATQAAREAKQNGDKTREAGFHRDLDGMVAEARSRGWTQGSGWKPARR